MSQRLFIFTFMCLFNINSVSYISIVNAEDNVDINATLDSPNSTVILEQYDTVNMNVDSSENVIPEPVSMLYVKKVKSSLNKIYKQVFTSLDNNGYFVVFEANIGKNLSYFAKRWGDDYNKNKLEAIRSMVFCNGWYANKVSNADPEMLAICPLHITFIHKNGITSILFVRPASVAINSPALEIAKELEQDVIRSIEEAIRK